MGKKDSEVFVRWPRRDPKDLLWEAIGLYFWGYKEDAYHILNKIVRRLDDEENNEQTFSEEAEESAKGDDIDPEEPFERPWDEWGTAWSGSRGYYGH